MWTVFVKHINPPTFWLLTCKSTSLRTEVGSTDNCDWSSDVKEVNTTLLVTTHALIIVIDPDNEWMTWKRWILQNLWCLFCFIYWVKVISMIVQCLGLTDLFDKEEEVLREENSALLWVCQWVLSSTVPTTQVRSPIYRPFYTLFPWPSPFK